MANAEVGNIWYIDSAGSLDRKPVRIQRIVISPTSGASAPRLTLKTNQSAPQPVLELVCSTSESLTLDFTDSPIVIDSLQAETVSDCVATLIMRPGDQNGV